MYYSNISNDELYQFHKVNKLNTNGKELNVGYDVSSDNKMIVPLFYFDTIQTTSDKLRTINEKIIINLHDTANVSNALEQINFNSEFEDLHYDVLYNTYTVNNRYFLILHFYDNKSGFALNNFKFTILHDEILYTELVTNNRGNIVVELENFTGNITINGDNGQTFNVVI